MSHVRIYIENNTGCNLTFERDHFFQGGYVKLDMEYSPPERIVHGTSGWFTVEKKTDGKGQYGFVEYRIEDAANGFPHVRCMFRFSNDADNPKRFFRFYPEPAIGSTKSDDAFYGNYNLSFPYRKASSAERSKGDKPEYVVQMQLGRRSAPKRFMVVSDLHFGDAKDMPKFFEEMTEAMIAHTADTAMEADHITGAKADYLGVITCGDNYSRHDGDSWNKTFYSFYYQQPSYNMDAPSQKPFKMTMPTYEGIGNHEGDSMYEKMAWRNTAAASETEYEERRWLVDYSDKLTVDGKSVDTKNVHYQWRWNGIEFFQLFTLTDNNPYGCKVKPEQGSLYGLSYFKERLKTIKPGTPIVICTHYLSYDSGFEEATAGHNVLAIFYGHNHMDATCVDTDRIKRISVPSGNSEDENKKIPCFNAACGTHPDPEVYSDGPSEWAHYYEFEIRETGGQESQKGIWLVGKGDKEGPMKNFKELQLC